jgi:hypothetical protein
VKRVLTIVAFVIALTAAPARADDAGLWSAYNGDGTDLDAAFHAYVKASRRYQHSHGLAPRRIKAVIRSERRVVKALATVTANVRAQEPSSDAGAVAKKWGIRGFTSWRRADEYEIRALSARLHGNEPLCQRWYRKVFKTNRISKDFFPRADRAFEQAGFTPPPDEKRLRRSP